MKAICWHGTHDVRCDTVPEPKIVHPRDAVVRITLTAICGSDLHLYDHYIPTMKKGDILGHEFTLSAGWSRSPTSPPTAPGSPRWLASPAGSGPS